MTSEQFLSKHEHAKKKKYLQACLAQQMHITPLVYIMNDKIGCETKAFVKWLDKHLAVKWDQPFL